MNKIIATCILSATIVLNLQASPPPPNYSTVTLKMTRTVEVATPPTKEALAESAAYNKKHGNKLGAHICFHDEAHYCFEPEFKRGLDAKSPPLVLNLYIITTNDKRKTAILKPISQIIPTDPTVLLVKDESYKESLQYRCKCRTEKRTMATIPEWYVEVIQDGKVLCSSQSKNNTTLNKLIQTRLQVSEIK